MGILKTMGTMKGIEYQFSQDGAYVFLKVPRCLLIFTKANGSKPLKGARGISAGRNISAVMAG